MFEICSTKPVPAMPDTQYQGMAFDGHYFYLTVVGKKRIVKLDKCLHIVGDIPTLRVYTSLSYDQRDKCFWATAEGGCAILFQLNCDLHEVGQIGLPAVYGNVSGVSYCCGSNALLVSARNKLLRVETCVPAKIREMRCCPGVLIQGVTGISPCYLFFFCKGRQQLCVIGQNGKVVGKFCPPPGHEINQVLYCGRQKKYDCFRILTSYQDGHSYVIDVRLPESVLGFLSVCNDVSCGCCCQPPCPPPCPPPSPKSCDAVLESIALVETGLAHILNAEGEKIQKALASTSCISEILKVNEEVNKTIVHVTHLEQVLYDKLDTLQKCCCQKPQPPCKKEGGCDEEEHGEKENEA